MFISNPGSSLCRCDHAPSAPHGPGSTTTLAEQKCLEASQEVVRAHKRGGDRNLCPRYPLSRETPPPPPEQAGRFCRRVRLV